MHLDRDISIEQKVGTQDATYGTGADVWAPLVAMAGSPTSAERFPARIEDALPGRSESMSDGLVIGVTRAWLWMRWRADVTSAMRVTVHGESNEVYQIVSGPAMIGRKEYLKMLIEKVTS